MLTLKGVDADTLIALAGAQDGVSVPQVHKRFFMLHWIMAEACSDCCTGEARLSRTDELAACEHLRSILAQWLGVSAGQA